MKIKNKKINKKRLITATILFMFVFSVVSVNLGEKRGKAFSAEKTYYETQSWWNVGWEYSRTITIDNSNNSYPMFINVSKTAGGDIDCNSHCEDDFVDIRFVDIDNSTELSYWCEKYISGVYAWFWVNLSSDITTDNKIVIYYGNSGVSTNSNGSNVFIYFDNWTVDHRDDWWSWNEPGELDTSNHVLNISGGVGYNKRLRYSYSQRWWEADDPGCSLRVGICSHEWTNPSQQYPDDEVSTLHSSSPNDGSGSITQAWAVYTIVSTSGHVGTYKLSYPFISTDICIRELTILSDNLTSTAWNNSDILYNQTYQNVGGNIPAASDLDSIMFLTYYDAGSEVWSYDSVNDQLIVGGNRSGGTAKNVINLNWMFLSDFNSTEPSVAAVGGEEQQGEESSVYVINGLTSGQITWSGFDDSVVWTNSSGEGHEWLEINMTINSTDNVTDILVYMTDLNDTNAWINASNITMYCTNQSNETYYSFGSFEDGGSNITLNQSTWETYAPALDNPFNNTGLTNCNYSIYCIFRLQIPAGLSTDTFRTPTTTSCKIYLGRYA